MTELKNNHDHEHDEASCGCGHDHDHDEHVHTVSLELENGEELECPILEIFEIEGKEYIALLHPDEEIALLYGFIENEDDTIELTEIVTDEEYEVVSKVFTKLFSEEDEEEEEE